MNLIYRYTYIKDSVLLILMHWQYLLKLSAIKFNKTNMVAAKKVMLIKWYAIYICYGCHWMQGSVYVSEHADTEKKMPCSAQLVYYTHLWVIKGMN